MIIPNDILPSITTEQFKTLKAVTEKLKDGWSIRVARPAHGHERVMLINPESSAINSVELRNLTPRAFRGYWKPEPKKLEFQIFHSLGYACCEGFDRFSQKMANPYDGVWRIILRYGDDFAVDLRKGEALHLTRANIDQSGDLTERKELFFTVYTVEARATHVVNALRDYDYVRVVAGEPQEHSRC